MKRMYLPEANLVIVASPEEPEGTGLLLEPNENPIARDYQTALNKAGLPPIMFGVADIQTEYERLKQLGAAFRREPTKTESGTIVLLEDTCGNLIQLHPA